MKKSDLRTGMMVKFNSGKFGIVMLNISESRPDSIVSNGSTGGLWCSLLNFNENLEYTFGSGTIDKLNTIDEVWSFSSNMNGLVISKLDRDLIWERRQKPKLTFQQVKEKLGFDFELVGEL